MHSAIPDEELPPDSFPPHIHHAHLPPGHQDRRSRQRTVVAGDNSVRRAVLPPHLAQLGPDRAGALREQTPGYHHPANPMDRDGPGAAADASGDGVEAAPATDPAGGACGPVHAGRAVDVRELLPLLAPLLQQRRHHLDAGAGVHLDHHRAGRHHRHRLPHRLPPLVPQDLPRETHLRHPV